MKTIWAPWRIDYILGEREEGCIFCDAMGERDGRGRRARRRFPAMKRKIKVPGLVLVILLAAGRDITSDIIPGAHASTPGEFRPFTVMISGGIGYGHPFGGYYEDMQDRRSWHVQLRAMATESTYLSLVLRNQQLFRGTMDVYDPWDGTLMPVETALDLRQYLFLIGLHCNEET